MVHLDVAAPHGGGDRRAYKGEESQILLRAEEEEQVRNSGCGRRKNVCVTLCFLRMATASFCLWLLMGASLASQLCCQHWSYGLSPGGKRDVDHLSDSVDTVTIC